MFSFFSRNAPADEMRQAKALFEKVVGLKSDSHDARRLRLRLSLLCRAHLDKTFIAGAEQTANWQDLQAVAVVAGEQAPPLPEASTFRKVVSGDSEIYVYLPREYAEEAFALGCKYQRAELPAEMAIKTMQALANQLCFYELGLEEPFQALQFLRDELAEAARAAEEAAAQAAATGSDATGAADAVTAD